MTTAHRLLAAMHAAEAEGGDFRGRRSACLVVVRAQRTGRPWRDRLVDLRVDDAVTAAVGVIVWPAIVDHVPNDEPADERRTATVTELPARRDEVSRSAASNLERPTAYPSRQHATDGVGVRIVEQVISHVSAEPPTS